MAGILLTACGAPTSPLQDTAGPDAQDAGSPDSGVEVVCGRPGETIRTWPELEALAGCTRLRGGILASAPDVASLEPLQDLRVIEGVLALGPGTLLTSLRGLENLERVGSLDVRPIELSSLEGLDALREVDGQLNISRTRIADLRGLENLTSVEHLSLSDNGLLESLRALERLRIVRGTLAVTRNSALPRSDYDWLLSRVEVGGSARFTR